MQKKAAIKLLINFSGTKWHNLLFKMYLQSINAYLVVMVREYNRQNTTKAAFIDSFAMTAIWKKKNSKTQGPY